MKSVYSLPLLALTIIPGTRPDVGITPSSVQNVSDLVDIIIRIVQWTYLIFFTLAVLFIILAAFTYLTAAAEPEKIKKAKSQIIYAVIAIAIALLAISFETIISKFIEDSSSQQNELPEQIGV